MKKSHGHKALDTLLQNRSWKLAQFQKAMLAAYLEGKNGLLNAPTGSGKTLAMFLPVLVEQVNHTQNNTHNNGHLKVLWLTPLRALARDLQKHMQAACDEMGVPWRVGIRTGDTSTAERAAQGKRMPEVLLTTPESLHLMLSQKQHETFFNHLELIVCDEWHELLGTKRGVQTELGLSRLKHIRPGIRIWGISATIGNLEQALDILLGADADKGNTTIIRSGIKKQIRVKSILPDHIDRLPWAGYLGTRLLDRVMPIIKKSKSTLLFTNTRSQTEIWYRSIMDRYPDLAGLVALHHGSLDNDLRNWVEDNLHLGKLKLVVCTSSLDLGVDFRPVETVIQVGSPKSLARFMQRAGRSGHHPGAVSKIYFVPTHALELIEAVSLREGIEAQVTEERLPVINAFDVLAQYMVTLAAGDGFDDIKLYEEVKRTFAYSLMERSEWEWLLRFITTGGATLHAYDEFHKVETDGRFYKVTSRRVALRHRLSMGTIVSDTSVRIKYVGGKFLGTIEESFISRLNPGDVFSFAGMNLEFVRLRDMTAQVYKAGDVKGLVPSWTGGRMPLSSKLSVFIRQRLDHILKKTTEDPETKMLEPLLQLQSERSVIPSQHQLLIEQCETREGHHIFIFPFEGRLVHEGMAALIAYRISKIKPITFSMAMTDYGFELLSTTYVPLDDLLEEYELFSTDNLLDDIMNSVNAIEMARRKFRDIATIAGMVFQGYPGGRQMQPRHLQASSSLLFNVLSEHENDNLLIRQAYRESLEQQLEEHRLRALLKRIAKQEIVFSYTSAPSPFAFPILVDRLREQLSSESLEDRVQNLIKQADKADGHLHTT